MEELELNIKSSPTNVDYNISGNVQGPINLCSDEEDEIQVVAETQVVAAEEMQIETSGKDNPLSNCQISSVDKPADGGDGVPSDTNCNPFLKKNVASKPHESSISM